MLTDEKILITGPAGDIGYGLSATLARDNEVWGIARFGDPTTRDEMEELGVTTRAIDLGEGDFGDLPTDFTHLVHLAAKIDRGSYDDVIRVNAEGTGLILDHCRNAKAALVMTSTSVYKPNPDPWHAYEEGDPLGDVGLELAPAYSVSKIAQEATARFCARAFDLPVTIARMNAAYGPRGGVPVYHMQAIAAGQPAHTNPDPFPFSPIHADDIAGQLEALLDAASVPATIVNWAGDEAVTEKEWATYIGELLGVTPTLGENFEWSSRGQAVDNARRLRITGPCQVSWRDGLRRVAEELFPDRVSG